MSITTNIGLFKHDNPATNTDEFNVDKALNQNWDKLDTAIGKDRERITTLETDNTTNKTDISNIKSKDTDQDKYISELEAENTRLRQDLNGLPKGQASGETIDLTNSAEMRCDLKIRGNSKQETRSGKNKLLNDQPTGTINGVTFTRDNSGIITANGTATDAIVFYLGSKFKTIAAGTYKLSDGRNDESNDTFFTYVDCYNTDGSAYATGNLSTAGTSAIKYTEPKMIKGRIVIRKGTTLNNIVLKPQLELVNSIDDKSTEYEPYGVSPSPDYPSEVESCGDNGSINEVICNKNLAKINTDNFELTNNTIKNKSTTAGGNILTHIKLKAGQTITSNLLLLSKPTKDTSFSVSLNGGDVANLSFSKFNEFNLNTKQSKTYTATEDIEFDVKIWGNANKDIFEFQYWIELDNTTEYVQHKSQTYTIPTQQPFRSVGNTRDTFIKKNNKWYERHYIPRKIFDGTEEIGILWNTGRYGYNIKISDMKMTSSTLDKSMILSNMYKVYTQDDLFNLKYPANGIACRANKNEIIIRDDNITTLSDLITNLSTNKPYVDYILETPLDIECTEEQNTILDKIEKEAKTYKNVTHIYSTDEISPVIDVTYKKDLDSRLTNIEQAILSQGGNI